MEQLEDSAILSSLASYKVGDYVRLTERMPYVDTKPGFHAGGWMLNNLANKIGVVRQIDIHTPAYHQPFVAYSIVEVVQEDARARGGTSIAEGSWFVIDEWIKGHAEIMNENLIDFEGNAVPEGADWEFISEGEYAGNIALTSVLIKSCEGYILNDEYNEIAWSNDDNSAMLVGNEDRYDFVYIDEGLFSGELWHRDECIYVDDCGYFHSTDENHLFWYHESCDTYLNYEPEMSLNHEYHDGPREWYADDDAKFTVGFEVEKEDRSVMENHDLDDVDRTGWSRENDSSLSDSEGFELVSPTYDLFSRMIVKDINNPIIADHLNANHNSSCGGHINIGMVGKSGEEFFDLIQGFVPIMFSLYDSRIRNGSWSRFRVKDALKEERSKYNAVRIDGKYIEFRMPSAVRNKNNVKWRIKLMRLMCEQVESGNASNFMYWAEQMLTPNTPLRNHLLRVFSEQRLNRKIVLACAYAERFYSDDVRYLDMVNTSAMTTVMQKVELREQINIIR